MTNHQVRVSVDTSPLSGDPPPPASYPNRAVAQNPITGRKASNGAGTTSIDNPYSVGIESSREWVDQSWALKASVSGPLSGSGHSLKGGGGLYELAGDPAQTPSDFTRIWAS